MPNHRDAAPKLTAEEQLILFGTTAGHPTGGSDGARTRDLRRDRPYKIQWNQ